MEEKDDAEEREGDDWVDGVGYDKGKGGVEAEEDSEVEELGEVGDDGDFGGVEAWGELGEARG